MKNRNLLALVAGLIFAVGLGISGMTDPNKVRAFLDVTGAWDPSLAFVMIGAIGVHFAFARRAVKKPITLSGEPIALPTKTRIDGPVLIGAGLFGLGWGIAGFCPGPALVSFAGGTSASVVAFVGAMVVGMLVTRRLRPPT